MKAELCNVFFVSLGCDKNLVDSEFMLGMIQEHGWAITNEEDKADVIIINTCCFINDAKEESINTILEMAEYKKSGSCKALLVTVVWHSVTSRKSGRKSLRWTLC